MRIWRLLIQAVGATTILLSAWGFYALTSTLLRGLEPLDPDLSSEAPYFRSAFLIMDAIVAVLLTGMIVAAVNLLIRASHKAVIAYTVLSVCLLIYANALGFLWRPGPVGMSIAAASGVGNVGLGLLVFFPVKFLYLTITVILANLASWRLRKLPAATFS